ncbi:hypothetical protein Xvtw_16475 [Xanthomonas campestris pv. vitiswoodrowii]|nr:hypothetical protein Xvtw_16475 [Xanthomonas campestris pv. vitiswoodrowii]
MAHLIQALEALLYQRPEIRPFPWHMSHLMHLSVYALSRLIFVMAEQLPATDVSTVQGRRRERPITPNQLEEVAKALDDWPNGFQRFLTQYYANAVQEDVFGNGFRQAFHWAFSTLENAEASTGATEFGFLREQVYRFGGNYLPRERLARGDRVRMPIANSWGSVLEAAAEVGMDPRTLLKRVKAGEIPAIEADYRRRNRNLLVDMQWLRRWKISRYAPVHERDAAETVGVSVALLRALRKENIYESKFHSRRVGGFSEEDISAFAAILANLVARYSADGTPGGIALDGVNLRTSKSIEKRVALVRALKARHPELWPREETGNQGGESTVEVEVSGHSPVIVRRPSGYEGVGGLEALYPWGQVVTANSVLEMVLRLISDGFKPKDVALTRPGDGHGVLDGLIANEFLRTWEGEWQCLANLQEHLGAQIPDWIETRRARRLLRLRDSRDLIKLEADGKLLGVLLPVWGERVYPTFQFEDRKIKTGIEELLQLLPRDPNGWAQTWWLTEPCSYLGGRRPIDVAEGDLGAALEVASHLIEGSKKRQPQTTFLDTVFA